MVYERGPISFLCIWISGFPNTFIEETISPLYILSSFVIDELITGSFIKHNLYTWDRIWERSSLKGLALSFTGMRINGVYCILWASESINLFSLYCLHYIKLCCWLHLECDVTIRSRGIKMSVISTSQHQPSSSLLITGFLSFSHWLLGVRGLRAALFACGVLGLPNPGLLARLPCQHL